MRNAVLPAYQQWLILPVFVAICLTSVAGEAIPNGPNLAAVQEVLSGARNIANAAWWGFDAEDATETLQAAVDSGVKQLIVPYMGQPWIVRPLRLRGDLELIFEPGVVVWAKKNQFKGKGDSLFSATDVSHLVLRGYGATLRMRHKDYMTSAYEKAEWRTVLDFAGCSDITIEGLRLESSGGDGIYLGCTARQPYCQDVVIRDVICDDNHRQGISVIGAVNLLIENCVLANTGGTAPQAGIDFEPNSPEERFVNCLVRNCAMAGNKGAGILVYLKNLSKESEQVSLRFENCHITGPNDVGMGVGAVQDNGPAGLIEFINCVVEGSAHSGAYIYDKSAKATKVRFVNCHWRDVWSTEKGKSKGKHPALLIHARRAALSNENGGIEFSDCHVYNTEDRPVLVLEKNAAVSDFRELTGNIVVHGQFPGRVEAGGAIASTDIHLVPAANLSK